MKCMQWEIVGNMGQILGQILIPGYSRTNCTKLHCIAMQCTTLRCNAMHYTAICSAIQCTVLHFIAAHCTATSNVPISIALFTFVCPACYIAPSPPYQQLDNKLPTYHLTNGHTRPGIASITHLTSLPVPPSPLKKNLKLFIVR